jgi:hypothetical protein
MLFLYLSGVSPFSRWQRKPEFIKKIIYTWMQQKEFSRAVNQARKKIFDKLQKVTELVS